MALWIKISAGSDKYIYIQIFEQISQAIAMCELQVGDKLPPVRKLAAELVVNPNTVARAYNCLEQAHLVTTKIGSGTFVSEPKMRKADAADTKILTERTDAVIISAINLGLEIKDISTMFRQRLNRFPKKQPAGKRK